MDEEQEATATAITNRNSDCMAFITQRYSIAERVKTMPTVR
jgi:hypothetical protein